MARFYGTVQGNRGEAHRLGHKKDGLNVVAKTWQRTVRTYLYVRDDDTDMIRLSVGGTVLFDMPVEQLSRDAILQQLAHDGVNREFKR